MKQLIIFLLLGVIGYLLYDKFVANNPDEAILGRVLQPISWKSGDAPDRVTQGVAAPSPVPAAGFIGNVKNISLAKMEHPETMTEDERQMAERWESDKPIYFTKLDEIKSAYKAKAAPPYRYNGRYAEKLNAAIADLENAINYDDFLVVPERCDKASDALRRFESSCVWQEGVSKGSGTHMHSGSREGSWEPDRGYTMVYQGGTCVAMQVVNCRNCKGTGSLNQRVKCPNCNGRGKVANPMARIGNVVNGLGGFTRGRRVHVPRVPRQQAEIPCPSCNRGYVERINRCPSCNGQGKIFK